MTDDLDRYLEDLDQWLVGPLRWRRDVVDEVRDGILEAARRHGAEHTPTSMRCAITEFGPASNLGPLLAGELRLRLARRAGTVALLLLATTGLAWQLYRALVGFPATTVPDGDSGQFFLASVAAVTTAPVVAQVGALSLVLLSSPRRMTHARSRLLRALAQTSVAATAITLVAIVAALATIDGTHRGPAAAAGAATTAVLATALHGMRRAALHVQKHAQSGA